MSNPDDKIGGREGEDPTACSKIWFESQGEYVFGAGIARLLENIDRQGTLQAGARDSHMSYRYAWNLIQRAEDHLGRKLLEKQTGGCQGGSSRLSSEGRLLLDRFTQLNREVVEYSHRRFAELCRLEKEGGRP